MSAFSRGSIMWSGCAAKSCSRALVTSKATYSQLNGLQRATIAGDSFVNTRGFTSSTILQASKKIRAAQKLRSPTPPNPNKTFGKFPHPASSPPQRIAVKPTAQRLKSISPSKDLSRTPTNITTTPQALPPSTTSYTTYADTLSHKSSPTSLYEAPNQTPFIITCTSLSLLAFGSGAYLYWGMVISPPAGLPGWVSIPYIITSFSLFGIATWIGIKPLNLIKSLSAIPQRAAARTNERLKIEIRHRSLPFLRQKTTLVPVSQIVLPYRLNPHSASLKLDPVEALADAQKKRAEQAKAMEDERRNLIFLPIRQGFRAFKRGVKSVRSRLSEKRAFMKVEVGEKKLKLDTKGWVLDKGKSLDRLFITKM